MLNPPQDEDSGRTDGEELNDFPELRLILNPGGCAMYQFPVKTDQQFAIIHPARKAADGPFESYAPKARVDVQVKANGLETEFVCFPEADSPDSTSCVESFVPVLSKNVTEVQMVLCVNESDPNTAAIWEIDISKVGLKWPDCNLKIIFPGQ